MNTEPTPGPWGINPSAFGERYIFPFPGGHTIATVHNSAPNKPGEANARLIAAAPDLLTALRASMAACTSCEFPRTNRCQRCLDESAAIAKATGGDA